MRHTLEQLQARRDRLMEKRENLLAVLALYQGNIRDANQAIKRKLKQIEKRHLSDGVTTAQNYVPPTNYGTPVPLEPTDGLSIPDFLKRDKAARVEIEQQNAERKRTKAQVRIEKMKAKQSGDTRKVPLTGRDALKFIRGSE